jgi:hypothetical protein
MVCDDYRQTTSATGLILFLDWDMLGARRTIASVNNLHKTIRGQLALPLSDYLRQASRHTRHSSTSAYIPNSTAAQTVLSFLIYRALLWIGTHYLQTSISLKSTEEEEELVGVTGIGEKMQEARLRWYGHVQRMDKKNLVIWAMGLKVEVRRPMGRPKKRWKACIKEGGNQVYLSVWHKIAKHGSQ